MYTKTLSEEKPIVMKRRQLFIRQTKYIFVWFCTWLLVSSCHNSSTERYQGLENPQSIYQDQVNIEYAIGFDVVYHQDWKELLLFRHYNDFVDTVRYALTSDEKELVGFDKSHQMVLPVNSIGALSTTQLAMFELLDALEQLKAIETKRYVHSQKIIELTEAGAILELAPAGKLNVETTIASGIEMLMGVGYPNSQNSDYQTLQNIGVPVILNADWQETSLLGRAEWIKLVAVLLNKENEVNDLFSQMVADYNQTLALVESTITKGPKTITGLANGDSWYVSGGNSFANHLLNTVKVDYPWSETTQTGSIRLDFETVYEQGLTADFWLVPSTAKTLNEIIEADSRYADFKSYKTKTIYNIYGRYTPGGGNDYYESAIVAPHIVLKDMVRIFHPDLLPDHDLVYYNQLN